MQHAFVCIALIHERHERITFARILFLSLRCVCCNHCNTIRCVVLAPNFVCMYILKHTACLQSSQHKDDSTLIYCCL